MYESVSDQFSPAYQNNVLQFEKGIDTFNNSLETNINLFATPGIDYDDNTDVVRYALAMITDRADSLYVIDAPRAITYQNDVAFKGTTLDVVNRLQRTGIDSNYACTYWPWIQIQDQTTGIYTYQAPTMMAVQSIGFTDNTAASWYAPAGVNRGTAAANIIKADIKLKKADLDTLYGGRINPIATFIQQGVLIWGQKTLQIRVTSLNRINVRRLLLYAERVIAAAAITLVFEQNDQTLRDQFLAKVEPILLNIQNQQGLYAFNVVMDSSNNNNTTIDEMMLVGKIQLQPTLAAEMISLTYQVLPTGANFSEF